MVIDFHTHIFPDLLATRARQSLMDNTVKFGNNYVALTEMTRDSLLEHMDMWGVDTLAWAASRCRPWSISPEAINTLSTVRPLRRASVRALRPSIWPSFSSASGRRSSRTGNFLGLRSFILFTPNSHAKRWAYFFILPNHYIKNFPIAQLIFFVTGQIYRKFTGFFVAYGGKL